MYFSSPMPSPTPMTFEARSRGGQETRCYQTDRIPTMGRGQSSRTKRSLVLAVYGKELAMIVAAGSDKNDEELAVKRLVGSNKNDKNDEELPDGPSARVGNSTSDDAVSSACTICAECETYYEKMYGVPETISTTTSLSCCLQCTKCTIILDYTKFSTV